VAVHDGGEGVVWTMVVVVGQAGRTSLGFTLVF